MTNPTPASSTSSTSSGAVAPARLPFAAFYREVFLDEHRHPLNVGLHAFGTIAGLVYVAAMLLAGSPWLVLLFPAVHAIPGLIGHRLVERNAAVGDVRVTRKDYPPHWFIAANHCMTWELFTGRLSRSRG
jgi:hypothetical protein